jgi:putative oxidoreductase
MARGKRAAEKYWFEFCPILMYVGFQRGLEGSGSPSPSGTPGRGYGEKEETMNGIEMEKMSGSMEREGGWVRSLAGHPGVIFVFRLLLAAIFLLSSIGKLVDIERYSVDAVYNFGILPMVLARPFGLVMPFIELLCGLGLLFGVLTRLSALGVALMSLAFFVAKAIVLSQGRTIECGCFGAVVDTLASVTIFMDIPMFLLALAVMLAPSPARHWLAFGRWLPERWKERLNRIW